MNPNIDGSVEAAGVFRALSDPFRLHIYTSIAARSRSDGDGATSMAETTEEIARELNMSPDLVEQHILELSRARLVIVGEDGDGRLTISVDHALMDRVGRLASGEDAG